MFDIRNMSTAQTGFPRVVFLITTQQLISLQFHIILVITTCPEKHETITIKMKATEWAKATRKTSGL